MAQHIRLISHCLEHFAPTSPHVTEEVNLFGEGSFYQLGRYSKFNKYLLQCKAGKFALKLLESRLLLTLKGEVAARGPLQGGGDGVHSCSRCCCTSGGDREANTGCSKVVLANTLTQAISTTILFSAYLLVPMRRPNISYES